MDDYIISLQKDLIEQFKGKPNIEALVTVIGKQFNDIAAFFRQLNDERSINTAVGKQLDRVGDIVVLSRNDAARLDGRVQAADMTDEEYRKYLIYKILRNTSDCTYYDIMKAIEMFWNGPPLKYSEDPNFPATLIFDFDASSDLGNQEFDIPFVKAGGVGLYMRMHKQDEFTAYYGLALQRSCVSLYGCNVPEMNPYTYLVEENGIILMDENAAWLIE